MGSNMTYSVLVKPWVMLY